MATSSFILKPLHDRVVVKPEGKGEKLSASGIIIPESKDTEGPMKGKVVAVGPGKYDEDTRIPMDVKVGDKVIFSKYGFDAVTIEGEEYYILSEASILGIIN